MVAGTPQATGATGFCLGSSRKKKTADKLLFPYEKHLYHWTSTHKKSYHEMFFCLITKKSFWGFFALKLGPDCSINSHKLTYNSHCSIWRWYHTCARFISVFPWKYISRSYGRIWHASFFPAMLYTSVVRVTLHPIPIPSFPIIPSLCAKVTFINLVPASEPPTMSNLGNFHGEKTAVLHGGGFNLATSATSIQLPSWERSHIPDTNGTFESMMFLFSQGGNMFFPWRVYNFCILKMVWFLVRLQITYLLAHYFRYARPAFRVPSSIESTLWCKDCSDSLTYQP